MAFSLALVGAGGKIAQDQHLPTLSGRTDFRLAAVVDRNRVASGVPAYFSLEEAFKAHPEIEAVVICTPPQARYALAHAALSADKHVFLEKPPGTSVTEVLKLRDLAVQRGLTLFAAWHSRFAAGVEPAREWLAARTLVSAEVTWKEDVRRWHPGQDWIFQPGGMGVFDPGINALSIVTRILPQPLVLRQAQLSVPVNRHAPIAADLLFESRDGKLITASFDFRQQGLQTWDIRVSTDAGMLTLTQGGAALAIDGAARVLSPVPEYRSLYDRFAALIATRSVDVDVMPHAHVERALLIGTRQETEAFEW